MHRDGADRRVVRSTCATTGAPRLGDRGRQRRSSVLRRRRGAGGSTGRTTSSASCRPVARRLRGLGADGPSPGPCASWARHRGAAPCATRWLGRSTREAPSRAEFYAGRGDRRGPSLGRHDGGLRGRRASSLATGLRLAVRSPGAVDAHEPRPVELRDADSPAGGADVVVEFSSTSDAGETPRHGVAGSATCPQRSSATSRAPTDVRESRSTGEPMGAARLLAAVTGGRRPPRCATGPTPRDVA